MVRLKPGDVFCSANPWIIGKIIMFAERLWSKDHRAEYAHAGIITSTQGDTFEALMKVSSYHLDSYKTSKILIIRPIISIHGSPLTDGQKEEALQDIMAEQDGRLYPFWRLIQHMIPPLAKLSINSKFLVCSEVTAKYLFNLGCMYRYLGYNPDDLADRFESHKYYEVVYKGVWR